MIFFYSARGSAENIWKATLEDSRGEGVGLCDCESSFAGVKTDGQNFFVTVKDRQVLFSRNKGQLLAPLPLDGVIKMFTGHASKLVEDTFIYAAKDLEAALLSLSDHQEFKNGQNFLNMELIYSKNPNVINKWGLMTF